MIKQTAMLVLFAAGCTFAQQERKGDDDKNDRKGPPPSAEEFIKRLDKDGDGKVSKTEFDGPSEHFTKFDKNGDGYISEDEVPSGPPPRDGKKSRK